MLLIKRNFIQSQIYNLKMNNQLSPPNKIQSQSTSQNNGLVTAWGIQSTVSQMEQFIRIIQQSKQQRSRLLSLLPSLSRIKKINSQIQSLKRQESQLIKNSILLGVQRDKYKGVSEISQENTHDFLIGFRNKYQTLYENQLGAMSQSLKKNVYETKKALRKLKEQILLRKAKRMNEIQKKKEDLLLQLQKSILNQVQVTKSHIITNIAQIQTQTATTSLYSEFFTQFIDQQLYGRGLILQQNSTFENGSQQIAKSSYNKLSTQIKCDLEQLKCRLTSLQDRKRKITVKNLLKDPKRRSKNNTEICSIEGEVKMKTVNTMPLKSVNAQNKNEKGILDSILSIFVGNGSSQNNSFHDEFKFTHSQNKMSLSNNTEENLIKKTQIQPDQNLQTLSLHSIQNSRIKLKVAEIKSQLVELKQQTSIAIKQNIQNFVVTYVIKINEINTQINSYVSQLIDVITLIRSESQQNIINKQQGEPYQSTQIDENFIKALRSSTKKQLLTSLKSNPSINEMLSIIRNLFIKRQILLKRLLFDSRSSLLLLIEHLSKKLIHFKSQCQQFILNDRNQRRSKSMQIFQNKTQIFIINQMFQSFETHINHLLNNKLLPLKQALEAGLSDYSQRLMEFIHYTPQLNQYLGTFLALIEKRNQKNTYKNQQILQNTFQKFKGLEVEFISMVLLNPQRNTPSNKSIDSLHRCQINKKMFGFTDSFLPIIMGHLEHN